MENKELLKLFHDKLSLAYKDYSHSLESYNKFVEDHNNRVGKESGYTIDLKEFNRIAIDMQIKFRDLYPFIGYINENHQFSQNVLTDYTSIIDSCKKNGLNEVSQEKFNELLQSVN